MRPLSRRGVGIVVAVVVLLAAIPLGGFAARQLTTMALGDGMYALLVLGSDLGPPSRPGTARTGRADGIHLVVLSPDRQQVTVLSFPRDIWGSIPGMGSNKINAALTRGPQTMVATVEGLTGIQVDDWILTGFRGLINGVDALGGVEIDVEQRLNDPAGAHSNLSAGRQTLDGTQSLAYLRDRKSRPRGDIARSASHAKFMAAVHEQLSSEPLGLSRMMQLVTILQRHTESSLDAPTLLALAQVARGIPTENIQRPELPVSFGRVGAASVLHLTPRARAIIEDVRTDGVYGGR